MKPASAVEGPKAPEQPEKLARRIVHCSLSLFGMVLLSIPESIVLRVDVNNNYA